MPFTGKAIYDPGVHGVETLEDVSPTISIISPFETPFLNAIGDAPRPATNIIHEYMEATLQPNSVTLLANANASQTTITITPGIVGKQLMIGTVIENENSTEQFMVEGGTSAGTLTIARAFAQTSAASIGTGDTLSILYNVSLEGADVSQDISIPRTRKTNVVAMFKKDIIISNTMQAVSLAGGVASELNYQIVSRSREVLRDLERAVIRSNISASTLGSASAYRSMKGLWHSISTNVNTYASGAISATVVNGWIRQAWDNGARDLNIMLVGKNVKDELDGLLETQKRVAQGSSEDSTVRLMVDQFESTYGMLDIQLNRWMRPNDVIITSTNRVKVLPLTGRSFRFQPIAPTGDATKAMIVGEYTMEVWNEEGMVKAYV